MLDISSLQYNAENPNLITVIYTICSALGLGILISFTYSNTTSEVNRHNHFLQALVLVTIVAATIIQAIGDSVARGLGMLGALSIIRFRTTVRDPRNIIFMFSAIAAGIACGVFGFLIAIVGTLAFCATAFLLKYTLPSAESALKGVIDIGLKADSNLNIADVGKVLEKNTAAFGMMSQRLGTKGKTADQTELRYSFVLKRGQSLEQLTERFAANEYIVVRSVKLENRSLLDL